MNDTRGQRSHNTEQRFSFRFRQLLTNLFIIGEPIKEDLVCAGLCLLLVYRLKARLSGGHYGCAMRTPHGALGWHAVHILYLTRYTI